MKKIALFVSLLFFACLCSCGSSSSSSSPSGSESGLYITQNSIKATPQIYGSLASASVSLGQAAKSVATVSDEGKGIIQDFFKLECHTDNNSLNFCPSGVDSTSLSTKFSTTTLIGLIQHADMYLGNIYTTENVVNPETGISVATPTYKTCEAGTVSAALVNHTPVYNPSNSNTFVVDFGNLFDCVGQFIFVSNTSYALYSKATDNLIFAGLTSRKQEQSTESYAGVMSDIFQSYVRRDSAGNPAILGSNLASFDEKGEDDSAGRSLLITNISANKFIVKYITGTNYEKNLVAIGQGGYNPTTSSWVDGYYMVKVKSETNSAETACVQNGLTATIVDDSNCSGVSDYFSDAGWTIAQVYEYLEASETDQTNLAGFNSFFDDDDFMASTDMPQNGSDYFPDSISN